LTRQEHEHRQAQLARLVADAIDVLLASVAHEDHGIEPARAPLLAGIAQQPADLGAAGKAPHRTHQAIRGPAIDLELVKTAIEASRALSGAVSQDRAIFDMQNVPVPVRT